MTCYDQPKHLRRLEEPLRRLFESLPASLSESGQETQDTVDRLNHDPVAVIQANIGSWDETSGTMKLTVPEYGDLLLAVKVDQQYHMTLLFNDEIAHERTVLKGYNLIAPNSAINLTYPNRYLHDYQNNSSNNIRKVQLLLVPLMLSSPSKPSLPKLVYALVRSNYRSLLAQKNWLYVFPDGKKVIYGSGQHVHGHMPFIGHLPGQPEKAKWQADIAEDLMKASCAPHRYFQWCLSDEDKMDI